MNHEIGVHLVMHIICTNFVTLVSLVPELDGQADNRRARCREGALLQTQSKWQ